MSSALSKRNLILGQKEESMAKGKWQYNFYIFIHYNDEERSRPVHALKKKIMIREQKKYIKQTHDMLKIFFLTEHEQNDWK